MDNKIAIVLNGGGARGSYQVGVLRALYEIVKKDQNLFDIITGNSAGAINAIFLAANADDWGKSTQKLVDLWQKIHPEDVYDINQFTMSNLGSRWVKGTILKSAEAELSNGLLDTTPLKKLLERKVDFHKIRQHFSAKILSAVSLSTTNYYSGATVVYYDGDQNIADWSKPSRLSLRAELRVEHVLASSAIPLFFPAVKINSSYFGDGCIRQITPLSPSIHLGANKIITIGIRHKNNLEQVKALTLRPNPNPPISQIGGVMMNAIFLDSLEADVERLEKMNAIVEMIGPKSPWRYIPILSLGPSKDLGTMTTKLNQELPTFIRYFLKGIGVTGQSGLDLLSYLAFDSSYTMQVVELGYEDTMAKKNLILNFLDS